MRLERGRGSEGTVEGQLRAYGREARLPASVASKGTLVGYGPTRVRPDPGEKVFIVRTDRSGS